MKTAFFIEGNPNNPGGYNQIINTAKFLGHFLNSDKKNYLFIVNNESLIKKLKEFEIDAILYKKTLFDKLIDYLFGFNFFYKLLISFNLKHSFAKFLKREDCALSKAGVLFSQKKKGIIPEFLEYYYNKRVVIKKALYKAKQKLKKLKKGTTEYIDVKYDNGDIIPKDESNLYSYFNLDDTEIKENDNVYTFS